MKKSYPLVFLFLFLILIQCGKESHQGNPNHHFDFNLPDLDGKIYSMKDFSGQILMVNFWATWCPPCLEEVPKLNDLSARYKNKGVQIIGIALDKDSLESLAPFVKENKVSYLVLVGHQELLAGLKNFKGMPTTILFDQEGKIYKRFDGSFDLEQLEESLNWLIEDQ